MTRARDVADTQDNTGGAVAPVVSGKNFAINGGFDIAQRGTSFTIGGTAATGTGGLVRAGSPALITPSMAAIVVSGWTLTLPTGASDTLVSKNSTDTLTNKSISGWQITSAVANATDSVKVGGVTITGTPNAWDVPIATSGTAATWWAPAGWWAATKCLITSNFETLARVTETTTGSGSSHVVGSTGSSIVTSNSAQGSIKIVWSPGGNGMLLFDNNPKFTTNIVIWNLWWFSATTTGSLFMGIGDIAVSNTAHTFTNRHIGFKVLYSGGNHTLFATQADWTTENASSALTTFSGSFWWDILELICIVNWTTSVDYYWRKNGGSLSSVTTLTGNVPTGATNSNGFQWSTQNGADSTRYGLAVQNFSYER